MPHDSRRKASSTSTSVGKISHFYPAPRSFFEFIVACEKNIIYEKRAAFGPQDIRPLSLHEKGMALIADYFLIGGMPESVNEWIRFS